MYVIGDVHGCYKTLLALIEKLPNKKKSKICFTGDLVDRGNNSYDVIKFVMENNYDCVLGNHEEMMLEVSSILDDVKNDSLKRWLYKAGGEQTLKSYSSKEDFYKHLEYVKKLPLYIEYKDYKTKDGRYLVVSHSSVGKTWSFRNSTNMQEKETFKSHVLWSRHKNFDNSDIFNVHGHTIYEEPILTNYSCAIDLGCHKTKDIIPNPRLCAFEFPSMKIITQENIE